MKQHKVLADTNCLVYSYNDKHDLALALRKLRAAVKNCVDSNRLPISLCELPWIPKFRQRCNSDNLQLVTGVAKQLELSLQKSSSPLPARGTFPCLLGDMRTLIRCFIEAIADIICGELSETGMECCVEGTGVIVLKVPKPHNPPTQHSIPAFWLQVRS
jgi:hypothetical protein